ncbi:MAG: transposase [Bacteroidota bacterium]
MKYNPNIHHRRSVRLKGYDYSQAGAYFITICTKDKECFFGDIINGEMVFNDIGLIGVEYMNELQNHFSNVEIVEYVVMPNHVHCILVLSDTPVRTTTVEMPPDGTSHVGTSHVMSLPENIDNPVGTRHVVSLPNVVFTPYNENQFSKPIQGSVSVIIQQYKASVKRWCNKNEHDYFVWQTRFHDHIIRNDDSYQKISNYIFNNPSNWNEDKLYKS